MADLLKRWDAELLAADLVAAGAGLAESPDLNSAVINSLFTDARATPELMAHMGLPADANPRGYWGDSYTAFKGDRYGSLLWTLQREKQTTETLNRARQYCAEALDWMIEDGLAQAVDVEAAWIARGWMRVVVRITLAEGRRTELHFKFALGEV